MKIRPLREELALAQLKSPMVWDLYIWLFCGSDQAGRSSLGVSAGGVMLSSRFD
jgi:hypothetical protein